MLSCVPEHLTCITDTIPSFLMAAKCGFDSCIVVPERTKDGESVCIHDDTVNRTARDCSGNPPEEALQVTDMTYEELLKWDFGRYKNAVYTNTKIPGLEEFLRSVKYIT